MQNAKRRRASDEPMDVVDPAIDGLSTSYQSQAGASTSHESQARPSTSYQSPAGPSTSYQSQAGPSTSYQSQAGPSTSYQSHAGPSTSYQTDAGPSTSYQSQAGPFTSHQSHAGPSTSYQSQAGPSTSYQSQAESSTSYQSQAGPSTSHQSQAGPSTSHQSQAGPSTSYQSQAGPSTSHQSQAGPSTSHQSQNNLLVNDDDGDGDDHISVDEDGGIRIGEGDIYIPPAPQPALSYDNTGPRLIISHIVNENFKSFAGVQCLGPFHKNYSSIIGRNGTGKSNVIDSMLFVFGFRASKIRSKKLSVLIHSSSKHPDITSTTVSVHFCKIIDEEGDDFTVVPGSEIVVSRTALRDSTSFYCLNGNRVLFKEVEKVLRSLGIDLDHSRFLILQNEVEQIAMMPPKSKQDNDTGMLEYLEDVIGTARFKEPIKKVALKVEEYTEICKHKRNRLRLAEQAMVELEEPMKDAVALIHLTNTTLRTRNMLLQKYLHESSKIIENKQTDLEDFNVKLAAVDDKLKKMEEELERKRNVLKEGTKKYDDLRKKKEEITEKLQGSTRNAVTTQAQLTQCKKKKRILDQLIEQERGKLTELELIPEKNQREIVDCEALLARRTEKKERAEEELQRVVASVITETQALQEEKDRLQAKQIGLKKIVDEANNRRKLAQSELKLYLSTERKEIEKLEKIKEDLMKVQTTLEEKKPLQEELSQTVPANEAKLREVNNKLQRLKETEGKIRAEVRPLRLEIQDAREAMEDKETLDQVLRAIMRELREGRILGIFGRLGDLGGIDAIYDIAISSCCARLDNILVDNKETATICVAFLRTNNIGKGHFIMQDKQEHWRPHYQEKRTYPENVLRLFDLVTVRDPRVKPVFYFVLRDTLIAKNLEQATRIGYGTPRYRVVTLAGEIVDLCGTMSGGGRPTRGKMGTKVQLDTTIDLEVIKAKELSVVKLEQSLAKTRLEQSELEETLGVLQRTLRNDKIELTKLNNEVKSLAEQVPIKQNHLSRQAEMVVANRVDPEQKAAFEASLETAQQQVDMAKDAARIVEHEVEAVDSQISAVAGDRVKDLQKTVNHHVKKIDKVISEITKLKVAINTSKRNVQKSKDKIQQIEADLTETERNLQTLKNQKREFSLEIEQLQKDLEDIDEQNDGAGEFLELKQEIQNLQTKENKTKAERLERNNLVITMEKSIQDCMDKIRIMERELRSLKLEEPDIEGIPGIEPIPPLAQHTAEELEEAEVQELRARLAAQKSRIGDKRPNIQAIKDYKDKQERYLQKTAEFHRITTRRNDMRSLHDQLKKKRITEFMCGFNTIAAKLQETYQLITLGGYAELELIDPLDPFGEGVTYSVRPPNKSWREIKNLSGGEKTLSSLALVFALHYYKPTPLYVMDEIDAALDFRNVSIVANYIKERTKNAQFIIISLRYHMFEVCDRLVGIYKTEDCTQSVTVTNALPSPIPMEIE